MGANVSIADIGIDKGDVMEVFRVMAHDVVDVGVDQLRDEDVTAGVRVAVEVKLFAELLVVCRGVAIEVDHVRVVEMICQCVHGTT